METRCLNFFSPVRKALRDSAFKIRMEQFRQKRLVKQSRIKGVVNVEGDFATKFTNEEILRKNVRVKRMVTRPTAVLPRRHLLFIKNGSIPLSLEDLSVPAASVFDESKVPNLNSLFSKQHLKDESWVFTKSSKKGVKVIEWKSKSAATEGGASISDITKKKTDSAHKKTDPEILTKKILFHTTPSAIEEESKSLTASASNLITVLKEKAVAYSNSGVNPNLLKDIESALGLERIKRNEELLSCQWTVPTLISSGRASVENFNLLIRALGHQKKISEAFAVHDTMVQLGFDTDQETYVSLIIAAGADAELARKAYLKMREMLIPANDKVYGALIKAHVKAEDLPSAFALLAKMEESSSSVIPVVVFTTLLDGLVRAGKTEVAFERFNSWRTWKNLTPDTITFSVMIKACILNAECEKALGFLDDLRQSGHFPTDITYTHLIECLSLRSDFAEKAFQIYNQMQLEGFEMNEIVAESLVRACANLGDVNLLRKTIRDLSNQGMRMSEKMYAAGIRTLANSKMTTDFEKSVMIRLAWYIVHDLRSNKSLAVSTDILNAVMEVYAANGDSIQTVACLAQFEKFDCAPNSKSYEILLEMYSKQNDVGKFFALFDSSFQNITNNRIFHLALDMAIDSRSSKRTVAVLESMLEKGLRPLPDAAEKLARVGRKVVQIHQVVGRMVAQQRDETHERTEKENALISLDIEEHRTRLAFLQGKTDMEYMTPENEAKQLYWSKKKETLRKSPKLAKSDFLEVKKKGGALHALKTDKQKPNILAD